MRTHWKAVICALGALLFALAPATANAEQTYFLVGVRHVYRIGPNRDAHLAEREEIEKNFADGVAQDQDTFNQHVANGADRDKESDLLNSDLDALADARDKSLGSLFDQCDYMRDRHPELKIQGDGPYQVMGLDFHNDGETEVVDRYCVYAPWPGYVLDGPYYGGWEWGVWYTPGVFVDLYWGWFNVWPGGRFWGGFWGHGGRVLFAPHGFNDRWHGGKVGGPRGGLNGGAHGGLNGRGAASGAGRSGGSDSRGGYTHSGSSYTRSSGAAHGGYTHSGSSGYSRSATSGGYGRSSASTTRSGGYSHSGYGQSSSAGRSSGSGYGGSSHSYTHSTDHGSHAGGSGGGYGGGSGHGSSSGASHSGSSSGSGRGGSGSHGRGR